ncbi:hypothetical protein HYALB_00009752 [Hymenoscyphus albidus]|uniref:Prolyl 4-hydroxylase alpha subunit Fe(2+) 2OG dioxygenase domain-containing protein n=1 Tax=Hymenoscyphus albidus TaxID=595503 RepID=A0A9N9LI72_9HELO|nr:hypothetical protein HYALB_00009752 [Hymenoscyphus albidus]
MAQYTDQALIDQAFREHEDWSKRPNASVPKINLKPGILECLTNLHSDATTPWALCESIASPPSPGICLKYGGGIGLPLSDGDAKVLVSASYESSSAEGDIAEWMARNLWEFSAEEFELTNPNFGCFVTGAVKKVTADLGVDVAGGSVRVELHKMTLRDAGEQTRLQNSEATPSNFATLEICLPSKHEGGEVQFSFHGQRRTLQTAGSSPFDSTYLAWFSNVVHEANPIIKGRRLSLTYNLFHQNLGRDELRAGVNVSVTKLKSLLSSWKCDLRDKTSTFQYFTHMLDGRYDGFSLSFSSLKGRDLTALSGLLQLCDELELELVVYLANIEVSVKGNASTDNEIVDVDKMLTSLLKVVDSDGRTVAENMQLNDPHFIQGDGIVPFKGKKPDEIHDDSHNEDQGYTDWSIDHYEPYLRYVFHQTVAIVMPRSFRPLIFFGPRDPGNDPWSACDASAEYPKPKVVQWIGKLYAELDVDDSISLRNDIRLSRRFSAWNTFVSQYEILKAIEAGMNEEGALDLEIHDRSSPHETLAKFAIGKARRQQIQQQCEAIGGFSFDEISGSGIVLVITKDLSEFQKEHQNWTVRFQATKATFERFGEPLRRMLGDKYLAITSLSVDGLPRVNWDARYFPPPPTQPVVRNRNIPFWGDIGQTEFHESRYGSQMRILPPITKPRKAPLLVPSGAVVIKLKD